MLGRLFFICFQRCLGRQVKETKISFVICTVDLAGQGRLTTILILVQLLSGCVPIFYEARSTVQGLPEPNSPLRGSRYIGARAAEHKGCN